MLQTISIFDGGHLNRRDAAGAYMPTPIKWLARGQGCCRAISTESAISVPAPIAVASNCLSYVNIIVYNILNYTTYHTHIYYIGKFIWYLCC